MSDWKSRATPVEESSPSDWKTRAVAAEEAPQDKSLMQNLNEGSEDILRGTGQGLSLGYSDEILAGLAAAGQAASDAIRPDQKLQSMENYLKIWRQKQKEEEAANDVSAARSPWLYHGAEIGSAIIPGLVSGGVGTAGAVAKLGLRQVLKEGGKRAVAKELGKAALHGGKLGAIAGIGGSHGTIEEDPTRIAQDALTGFGIGGFLGAGVRALPIYGKGPLVEGEANAPVPHDNPKIAQAKLGFQKGMDKQTFGEAASQKSLQAADRKEAVEGVRKTFDAAEEVLKNEKEKLLGAATKKGVSINPSYDADESARLLLSNTKPGNLGLDATEAEHAINLVTRFQERGLGADEANQLKKYLSKINYKSPSDDIKSIAEHLSDQLELELNNVVPGYSNINKEISSFLNAGKESFLDPSGLKNFGVSGMKDAQFKVQQKIEQMLSTLRSGGEGAIKAQGSLDNLIQELEKLPPETLQKLKINPQALKNQITSGADVFGLQQKMMGAAEPLKILGTELPASKYVMKSANVAGRAVGAIEPYASKLAPVAQGGRALYSAGKDALGITAKNLSYTTVPSLMNLGEALQNALDSGNEAKKNAVLFSIHQNPEARKALGIDLSSENK